MSVSTRSRVLATLALTGATFGGVLATMPSSSAATTTRTTASAASGVLPRTAIPWKSVTKGWVVAEVARGGQQNLVLVSPAGQSYQIMTMNGRHLAEVSPDGKRVLLYGDHGLQTLDLATGRTVATVPVYDGGSFTRPNGLGVIGTNSANTLVNYSAITGKLTTKGANVGAAVWTVTPAPNGLSDVIATSNSVKLYNHANLQPIRSFAAPKGYVGCQPLTFIDSTHFRETCMTKGSAPTGVGMAWTSEVFTQSIAGGTPVAVTAGTYPGGTSARLPLGFSGAWNTSKGTIAAPNVIEMHGSTHLYRVVGTKVAQTYTAPMAADAARMSPIVKTMVGTSAYFTSNLDEPGPSIALRYDVATNKMTYLAGAHSQYGGVVSTFAVVE